MNSIIDLAKRAKEEGLLFRTWGNFSERIDEKSFLITPSGMDYDQLNKEDLCTMSGAKSTGLHKPSSESPLHERIYKLFSHVKVIMHTHQPYASAIGLSTELHPLDKEMALNFSTAFLPISPYALPSTGKLHKNAIKTLKKHPAKVLLLEKHGAVIMGESYEDVLGRAILLEEVCRKIYYSLFKKEEEIEVNRYSLRKDPIEFYEDNKLSSTPIDAILHDMIYDEREDINVIMVVKSPDLRDFYGSVLYPYLDDFAQIVGIKANESTVHNVLLTLDAALILAPDMEEALAIKHILDKNAKAARVALYYGAKPIGELESKLMNFIYQEKYAKLKNKK
ncbi:MAG TPA: class II aldolase/adducin family protein [Clostridia bacterium]|nr:class II aldolase/adducin family protein [Clostridia bacterium]